MGGGDGSNHWPASGAARQHQRQQRGFFSVSSGVKERQKRGTERDKQKKEVGVCREKRKQV